jgi:hypothetical protein
MFADKDRIVQGRSRRFVHKRSLYRTCSKSAQYLTNVDKKNCIENVMCTVCPARDWLTQKSLNSTRVQIKSCAE